MDTANCVRENWLRHDWTKRELRDVYQLPLPELIFQAQLRQRQYFPKHQVQVSSLLSIKTGACPEDCKYCPQSAHYKTGVEREKLLSKEKVLEHAAEAKRQGASRFCMGAAWREVREGSDFEAVLDIVRGVASMNLEVCCTLGMLNYEQAQRLKDAGCHAYNHNLDTSPEYYEEIITTRTYQERLETLANVRRAGITVCCGGIIGMGESLDDRLGLLEQLAQLTPHPESVPINMLVPVAGTPLEQQAPVDPLEFVRIIATARIAMPASFVRLSAGRLQMSEEMQALCFLAGANSIFSGTKLLVTANPGVDRDRQLLDKLGLKVLELDNSATSAVSFYEQAN